MGVRLLRWNGCERSSRCHSHDIIDGEEVCPYPEKPWTPTFEQWVRIKLSRFFAWIARIL